MNALVNTQFTYIDTGVNVELLPRVHDNGDVTIHVDLNINSVSRYVDLGGISQPVISQKKISHDIRMREGEVGLLGGLINEQEAKTVTGIPGLSRIPILGRLFSGDSVDRSRDELMIVLIPHVIRRPEISAENLRAIAVGNFATVKVSYAPKPAEPAAAKPGAESAAAWPATALPATAPPATAPPATAPPATAPPATAPPATAPPATAPPATAPPATAPPATAPPATAPPATAPPATAPPATAPPATAPRPGGAPAPPPLGTAPEGSTRVYFLPSQATAEVSGRITVSLVIEGGADVASAPMQIQFDPKFIRLNDVSLGDFFSSDGQQPVFTKNILNDTGVAAIQLNRPPGSPGVGGSGTLVALNFQALARGATTVTIPRFTVRNAQGEVISSWTPQFTVIVK